MMNTLPDLNNLLFEQIERLNDDDLTGKELEEQLSKSRAIGCIAQTIVKNATVILSAARLKDSALDAELPKFLSYEGK